MGAVIECHDLTKRYGSVTPVQSVNLSVEEGECAVIFGESGSGKSTLLRLIAGLEEVSEGRLLLFQKEPDGKQPLYLRQVAMVFQEASLWNHMTVEQNITYGIREGTRQHKRESAHEIMHQLGLDGLEKRYPYEISGGQAKRVALARACAAEKKILLLDEPLSNLDRNSKSMALQFLKEKIYRKCTILYVTHDIEETKGLCDIWYHMEQGHLTKEAM